MVCKYTTYGHGQTTEVLAMLVRDMLQTICRILAECLGQAVLPCLCYTRKSLEKYCQVGTGSALLRYCRFRPSAYHIPDGNTVLIMRALAYQYLAWLKLCTRGGCLPSCHRTAQASQWKSGRYQIRFLEVSSLPFVWRNLLSYQFHSKWL